MTDSEYSICETQGYIFELAANLGYDMELFANEYLTSRFCEKSFDTGYSRYFAADAEESWEIFYPEIKDKLKKYGEGKHFRADAAAWIGFTYRQLWFETAIPSGQLVRRIPFLDMIRLYPGLHTIDEEMAAERLIERYALK